MIGAEKSFDQLAERMARLMDAGEMPNPGEGNQMILLLEDLVTSEDRFTAGQTVWAPKIVADTITARGAAVYYDPLGGR